MKNQQEFKKWTELFGMTVFALAEGKKLGTIDNFYFDTDTNAIRGLRLQVEILGYRVLPTLFISLIEQTRITTANEDMLIVEREDPQLAILPLGQMLFSYRVVSESGKSLGRVKDIYINTATPTALHVSAFELSRGSRQSSRQHPLILETDNIAGYTQDAIIVLNQVARHL